MPRSWTFVVAILYKNSQPRKQLGYLRAQLRDASLSFRDRTHYEDADRRSRNRLGLNKGEDLRTYDGIDPGMRVTRAQPPPPAQAAKRQKKTVSRLKGSAGVRVKAELLDAAASLSLRTGCLTDKSSLRRHDVTTTSPSSPHRLCAYTWTLVSVCDSSADTSGVPVNLGTPIYERTGNLASIDVAERSDRAPSLQSAT
ncbi:uncharacterized protein C8Q71DRAFT_727572 [Rhodofomes roseus]|uniref:Transposase n=1 Tax=Rhodofomes roseus TaxID=34475 RepID=A0ABQ8K0Z1_9APHY|nr:uncharacterized protein C8Q71DRAFT_727572 [Rhodofomes roseus]KAH9830337.1 hypothetical protein C8Q71DRAFT_727572 [Rhodofomes roseus]